MGVTLARETCSSAPLPQARDTVPQTLVYSDLTELSPFCSSEDTFFKVPAWHRPTDWSTQKVPASRAHAGRWQFPPPNVLPHFCAPLSPEELPAFSWVAVRDRGNHRSHFLSCVMDVCSVLSYFSGRVKSLRTLLETSKSLFAYSGLVGTHTQRTRLGSHRQFLSCL